MIKEIIIDTLRKEITLRDKDGSSEKTIPFNPSVLENINREESNQIIRNCLPAGLILETNIIYTYKV